MNEVASIAAESIRLVFELDRADNPRLYDDLVRFKKGTKRVNRLRTLAQEGLLAEHLPIGFRPHPTGRWLIGAYYRMVPGICTLLTRWPWLRPIARAILKPIAWLVDLALCINRGEDVI